MSPSILYRTAAVLILLFAIGHTIGYSRTDPAWGIDQQLNTLRQNTFTVQGGFQRNYLDFYAGFALFVTVLLLFAAAVAWQLGGLPPATLSQLSWLTWGIALSFAGSLYLSWRYFFIVPLIFSAVIFVCLAAAALMARSPR